MEIMSLEKVSNWLKNSNEDGVAEDYIFMIQSELSEIQNSAEFTQELQTHNALGNKIRFSIYKYLEKKELCTCVLSKLFDIKEATISHHLRKLERIGVINSYKKGNYSFYHLAEDQLINKITLLNQIFK